VKELGGTINRGERPTEGSRKDDDDIEPADDTLNDIHLDGV